MKRTSKPWNTVGKGSILKARCKESYMESFSLTRVIAILVIPPACLPDELGMHLRHHQRSSSDSPSTCADLWYIVGFWERLRTSWYGPHSFRLTSGWPSPASASRNPPILLKFKIQSVSKSSANSTLYDHESVSLVWVTQGLVSLADSSHIWEMGFSKQYFT